MSDLKDGFDLFLLGDPESGWIPTQKNQEEFAALLDEIGYKRPALIYHCFLRFERIDGEGRVVVGDPKTGWSPPEEELVELREKLAKLSGIPFTVVRVTSKG